MSELREALEDAFDDVAEAEGVEVDNSDAPRSSDAPTAQREEAAPEATDAPKPAREPRAARTKPQNDAVSGLEAAQPKEQYKAAPVSWRPEVREKFNQLPPDVQQEVMRREIETQRTLSETAGARKFSQEISQVLSPYMADIQAEGGTPTMAIQNLFNTANTLRRGSPQQKAMAVAGMVQQFGIDVNLLDSVLTQQLNGHRPQLDPTTQYLQQQLAPMQQFMQEFQGLKQQAAQRQEQEVVSEITTFVTDPKNEYANDPEIRGIMADLLDAASKRGYVLPLDEAYKRATMSHPSISKRVMERQLSSQTAQQSAAARRARNIAGASIPAGGAPEQSQNNARGAGLRSAIEAAWDTGFKQG